MNWKTEAFQAILEDRPEAAFALLKDKSYSDLKELDDKVFQFHSAIEMFTLVDDYIFERNSE